MSNIRNPAVLNAMMDFYRCPNTGRVLDASKTDDKVLCGCGRPAPRAVAHYRAQGRGPSFQAEPPGTHVKVFIERTTAEAYLAQEEHDDQNREYSVAMPGFVSGVFRGRKAAEDFARSLVETHAALDKDAVRIVSAEEGRRLKREMTGGKGGGR